MDLYPNNPYSFAFPLGFIFAIFQSNPQEERKERSHDRLGQCNLHRHLAAFTPPYIFLHRHVASFFGYTLEYYLLFFG